MTFRSFSSILYPYPSDDYDYIGNESCIDFQTDNNKSLPSSSEQKMKSCIRNREKKREFPPPIPCLAQTQNLASHMPYVLKRYYTDEGRLIIKEEKVKHHEYFHAHRENGRLTLQLVPLDYDDDDDDFMEEEEEVEEVNEEVEEVEEEEEIDNVIMDQSVIMKDDFEAENMDNTQKNVAVGDDEVAIENQNEIIGGANTKPNYLNCNNSVISSSSGIFGVLPLQPIRTVRG